MSLFLCPTEIGIANAMSFCVPRKINPCKQKTYRDLLFISLGC
jgi:hypothetical protein